MMRKLIQTFFILLLVHQPLLQAQVAPDSVYYERLFYTGKIWGFLKYFHSEVATGNIDWDSKLISALTNIKNDTTNQDFNVTLSNLIYNAGEMARIGYPLYDVHDSLKYNLNLNWLDDPIFSDSVKAGLDTVKTRFRRQNNYYVGEAGEYGGRSFDNDNKYYQWGSNQYPDENRRLLALFRYWNIINYFFPYKYIMDQNWDSTLVEFIPKIINAKDATAFHYAFLEFATRINDSHAFTYSELINGSIVGRYYLPITLKYMEDETVVTGVFTSDTTIKFGDIIKSIGGNSIYTLRDNLKQYTAGSNKAAIERDINKRLLRGQSGNVQMVLENSTGQKNITVSRNVYISNYQALIANKGPIWKTIDADSGRFGYVDMGRLEVEHVENMFSDFWSTDALIFDIRNYPNETMWEMINYLFDEPIHNAKITKPDIYYPGTLYWERINVGKGDFSKTYDKPVFILFNEITQSQAEYTIMTFEQHPKSIKIGSQTAGADGNISNIYLPGGIITYFSCFGAFYPDYTPTQRIGIVPDIEVHPTIQGIREGRDEVLECALKHKVTSIDDFRISTRFPNTYLLQNYPNPFNPTTTIGYQLPIPVSVEISIYNILGQKMATLINKKQPAGTHKVEWNANSFASGIYFYKLATSNGYSNTKKLILMK